MKRRVVCFLLAAFLLLGLIPATAVTANAASNLTTSEKAIELLKKFEGFSMYAKWDYAQWSIGYGSRCEEGEYPNGITKDEADTLLRKELVGIEAALNSFADTYKLTFKQNQFDALILFSYLLKCSTCAE
jgi:GH24 family phage-related lysozyme (muramidase)